MLKAPLRVCGECTHEHAAGKAYFLSTVLKKICAEYGGAARRRYRAGLFDEAAE